MGPADDAPATRGRKIVLSPPGPGCVLARTEESGAEIARTINRLKQAAPVTRDLDRCEARTGIRMRFIEASLKVNNGSEKRIPICRDAAVLPGVGVRIVKLLVKRPAGPPIPLMLRWLAAPKPAREDHFNLSITILYLLSNRIITD
jgi:hypothetical protein